MPAMQSNYEVALTGQMSWEDARMDATRRYN